METIVQISSTADIGRLLDLPMRDGNVKMPKRWSNLLLLLDLPMRDGNTDSSQEAYECPAFRPSYEGWKLNKAHYGCEARGVF